MSASIVLINPKYIRNLASTMRAAACFGAPEIRYTGHRADEDAKQYERLPRELRISSYDVTVIADAKPLNHMQGVPVAVEVNNTYMPLPMFEHPEDAIYVFGPEDGDIPRSITKLPLVRDHPI